jgi:hypothetical protein
MAHLLRGLVAAAVVLTPTIALAQQPAPGGAPGPAPAPAVTDTASVRIATSDQQGQISIDGALVGQGIWAGQLTLGNHEVKITRDGYDPLTDQLVITTKDPISKNYTLNLVAHVTTGTIQAADTDALDGIYGGFLLMGYGNPGGLGTSVDQLCDSPPTSLKCDTASGIGGGLGGFIGYHFDPVGVELLVAGNYDERTETENWSAVAETAGLQADPPRTEEYHFRRAGVMFVPRIRVTKQWKKFRLMLPIGAGISYRIISLERDTKAKDNGDTNKFVADSTHYLSPVIQLEPTIAYRLTPGVSVTLGLEFFMETPGSFLNGGENPRTATSSKQTLGVRGLGTPSYQTAGDAQFYVGPVIGMMFGP